MLLSLKKLSWVNIGRFVEKQTLDFTSRDKISQINGLNKNTGGSSGSAKSTVFNALDYNLGVSDIPATALQSRLTKEPIWTETEWDIGGRTVIITRSKKTGLTIVDGDEITSGNSKIAEEKLDHLIQIPRKIFKKMIHKKQKEGAFFLNLTAKEVYEFLTQALDLGVLTEKQAVIDNTISTIQSEIDELTRQMEVKKESIESLEKVKKDKIPPENFVSQIDVKTLKEEVLTLEKRLNDLNLELSEKISSIEKPQLKQVVLDLTEEESVKKELSILQNKRVEIENNHYALKKQSMDKATQIAQKLSSINQAKNSMKNDIDKLKTLSEEKKHIESSKCPTCSQTWVGDGATEKISKIQSDISVLKNKMLNELKPLISQEPTIQEELAQEKSKLADLERLNVFTEVDVEISNKRKHLQEIELKNKSIQNDLKSEYEKSLVSYDLEKSKITSNFQNTISELRQQILAKKSDIEKFEIQEKNYLNSLESYKRDIASIDSNIEENRSTQEKIKERLNHENKRLKVAEEAKRLIKTYILQVFQDTLDYIGDYATDILSHIPNVSNASIHFEGCKETQKGAIKDEVTAIINMDGYENVNLKTLSGGERTAIDLAVDIAVIDMIEIKAGKGADFFILDEPFNGLEDVNISQCLEILKNIDTNKKIMIVDHNPIAKEMISDNILVVRDGETSTILE